MLKVRLFIFLAALCISTPCLAIVFGGSNLGILGYPEHDCRKPYKPFEFTEQYQVDSYNNDLERYIHCIEEYLENASNDIKRIKEAADTAIDDANSQY